ncbi:MAG TPA: hypothetical protein VJZ32_04310 [Candidatus Bathyarchaeia archaeon]|nr:hypothetical protein [Candidatus Bathyarchaeia archaeon]
MSVDELAGKGSPQCKEAFVFLREQLKADPDVEETIEYEPLKESDAPSYNVREMPRVRLFFGEKLEIFLFIPEKAVSKLKEDESIPPGLRAWIDRAQLGGMSRLLRVQLGSKKDVEVLLPLVMAVTKS